MNKTDLAPFVGVDLDAMLGEARTVRDGRPSSRPACTGAGVEAVADAMTARLFCFADLEVSPCSIPSRVRGTLFARELTQPRSKLLCAFATAAAALCSRTNGSPTRFTRHAPFYLDPARPDLATLYLQSASGGLYRGDRVALSIVAEPLAPRT